MKAAFFNENSANDHIVRTKWDYSGYTELRTQAQNLKRSVEGYSEEEISQYSNIPLPDQMPLSLYIACCICNGRQNPDGRLKSLRNVKKTLLASFHALRRQCP